MITIKKIKITGMQCGGCENIIEAIIKRNDGVIFVKANHSQSTITIIFDQKKISLTHIQEICATNGYDFQLSLETNKEQMITLIKSLFALIAILILLIIAKKSGHFLSLPEINSKTSGGIIFLFGLLTGVHCVGMCGGFIIGYSGKDATAGHSLLYSHLLYGAGKTLSYTFFGALFGLFGSLFQITPLMSGLTIGLAGIFLILYGLSSLNLFSFLKSLRITKPSALMCCSLKNRWSQKGPFLIGISSGLLFGCGPLQMMYMLAAGNGKALEGAILLLLFGLGTLPILLSFGLLTRLLSNSMTRRFLQYSSIILIIMGMMMINTGFRRTSLGNEVQSMPLKCHGHHS